MRMQLTELTSWDAVGLTLLGLRSEATWTSLLTAKGALPGGFSYLLSKTNNAAMNIRVQVFT